MSAPDGGDSLSVARCREPVVNGRPDSAALHRRVTWPGMAGHQQKHPLAVNQRLFQRPVDRLPGAVKIMAMKIDHAVRLDSAGAQCPVP